MANREELLDELLKDCKNADDLLGKDGLVKDLTKALIERALTSKPTWNKCMAPRCRPA